MGEQLMSRPVSAMGEYQESKALSEIKGKVYLARQFPRDPNWSLSNVLRECERIELAESAQYEFPRGDSVVKGPSIRLVEVLARHWGNIDFGVTEIDAGANYTTVKAFAWDLENNVCDEKVFTVKHERSTKKGAYKLTDERDIYEMVANKGARRKRACLLSVMPGWYVEAAASACEETLKKSLLADKSIDDVRAALCKAFEEYGIDSAQIAAKMNKEIEHINENDIVKLRHLYSAIKDGFVKPNDAFGIPSLEDSVLPTEQEEENLFALNERLKAGVNNAADKG